MYYQLSSSVSCTNKLRSALYEVCLPRQAVAVGRPAHSLCQLQSERYRLNVTAFAARRPNLSQTGMWDWNFDGP